MINILLHDADYLRGYHDKYDAFIKDDFDKNMIELEERAGSRDNHQAVEDARLRRNLYTGICLTGILLRLPV